ncbi:hypothetical protein FB446DRAFT_825364 [Lentinula raphanica]|nr:hypothetical protein FB446DRAFT_825364 [Lentinula raphanica]
MESPITSLTPPTQAQLDQSLQRAILISQAYPDSVLLNPRRTEDTTHPLWSAILYFTCLPRIDRCYVVPQKRISLVAPLSDADPNKTVTLKAGGIEVISDFTVMSFVILPKDARTILDWQTTSFILPPSRSITVIKTYSPIFVELKRPISRNCRDIHQFMSQLTRSIDRAQQQVREQVYCYFCVPQSFIQSKAAALAATHGWWCFCHDQRAQIDPKYSFNAERYRLDLDVDDQLKVDMETDVLMNPHQVEKMRQSVQGMKHSVQETKEQKVRRQNQERAERYKKRSEPTEGEENIQQKDFWKFVATTEQEEGGYAPYSFKTMDKYSQKRSAWDKTWAQRWGQLPSLFQPLPGGNEIRQEVEDFTTWSGIMLWGTEESTYWHEKIKEYLVKFVDEIPLEDDNDELMTSIPSPVESTLPSRTGSRQPSRTQSRVPSRTQSGAPSRAQSRAPSKTRTTTSRPPSPSRPGSGAASRTGSRPPSHPGSGAVSRHGSRPPSRSDKHTVATHRASSRAPSGVEIESNAPGPSGPSRPPETSRRYPTRTNPQ